jgi:hypothetical protein
MGGEACPPEIGERLARGGREVWNTYGPTEATVVACGAALGADGPVRIGLPLDGWDLAVVDPSGRPVADGETGELIIGGVGLARYLDPVKDAEKYAAMPSRVWSSPAVRTTRSSSAAAASSSARSTVRCWACPASSGRPPPYAGAEPATSCSSGTSRSRTASTRSPPGNASGRSCRPPSSRGSPR